MMSKITAVAKRPSGNTMSMGWTGCPANLTLLSMVASSTSVAVASAPELLLYLLQAAKVPLQVGHRLLQICLELIVLDRRQDLILDPLDVRPMIVDLMLNERLVEIRTRLALEIGRHGHTVRR